ncbi:MAG: hypothetical protein KME64_07305 [Scytonematopsis contorta HA4267-MV1]|nr:hypothetical protein [Scytonematopsis contorta HA4267-MV1]
MEDRRIIGVLIPIRNLQFTIPHSPLPIPHSPLPTPYSPLPTPHSPLFLREFYYGRGSTSGIK